MARSDDHILLIDGEILVITAYLIDIQIRCTFVSNCYFNIIGFTNEEIRKNIADVPVDYIRMPKFVIPYNLDIGFAVHKHGYFNDDIRRIGIAGENMNVSLVAALNQVGGVQSQCQTNLLTAWHHTGIRIDLNPGWHDNIGTLSRSSIRSTPVYS